MWEVHESLLTIIDKEFNVSENNSDLFCPNYRIKENHLLIILLCNNPVFEKSI